MIKFSLALLPVLLSGSAFAQVRIAAPTPGAAAWAGPIAGAVGAAGLERVCELGSVSLPRLATPGADGRLPFFSAPQLLNPLVETLVLRGEDPARFAALPTEAKLKVLAAAAVITEERLAMQVWRVALDTNKGIGRSEFPYVASQARYGREMSVYINDRSLIGLDMLEKRVAAYQALRQEAWRAFVEDLPAKLAAGAFDAKNLIGSERDGDKTVWLDAAGNPEVTSHSPDRVIGLRLGAIGQMQPGPWSAAEVDLLRAALRSRMMDGTISPSRWTNRTRDRLQSLQQRSETMATQGHLGDAVARFSGNGRVTAHAVRSIDAYYKNAVVLSDWSWPAQARVLAAIHKGGLGFPSWKRLQAAKEQLAARADFASTALVLTSMAASLGAVIATLLGYFRDISPAASLGLIAALLLPLIVSVFFFDDRSLAEKSRLSELMSRYFK